MPAQETAGASAPARKVFFDFEASGLGARSWPVEVGWVDLAGGQESFLIKPHEDWSMAAWDPIAEKLHGLAIETLKADGVAPRIVCDRLNAALRGASVYSDAPDWDAFWLFRLFSACSVRPAFSLLDYGRLLAPLIVGREERLFAKADQETPRRHRAIPDAEHLRALYRLAVDPSA